MKIIVAIIFLTAISSSLFGQKDSLQVGERYADDHMYLSVSYGQFIKQPKPITKSGFSYGISVGFMKDVIINTAGSLSLAAGVGYGYNFFDHKLQVEEINSTTFFSSNANSSNNIFRAHNIEFPLEFRWRTSSANKSNFWRIYTGIKFLYNLSNTFQFEDETNSKLEYNNVSAYNKLQYGLTLSTGYDAFNIYLFYGLTPVFENATINTKPIETSILKFGLIFYIL